MAPHAGADAGGRSDQVDHAAATAACPAVAVPDQS